MNSEQLNQKVFRINKKQGTQYTFKNKPLESVVFDKEGPEKADKPITFKSKSKNNKITFKIKKQKLLVQEFLKLLSTAHQCMPELKKTKGIEEIFY